MNISKQSEIHLPPDERRGIHPAVREAEKILARNWRLTHRRERQLMTLQILALCYGVALWTLTSLAVALIVVPTYPTPGACAIFALSVVGMALLATWRAWWRRSWHVEPNPYAAMVERVSRGGSL